MIPKSGNRFSEKIMHHDAFAVTPGERKPARPCQFGLASFCEGIVMVISRGFGCTKLASANIAP